MVLPIIMALASLAPTIMPLFTGKETSNKAAGIITQVATAITGTSSPDQALQALQSDPALLVEYQRQISEETITLYQEETKRLESVNQSFREEIKSDDPFVRRMRPFAGYIITLSSAALVAAVVKTIWVAPEHAVTVVNAATSMTPILVPMLSVVGVYVWKRSSEKMAGMNKGGGDFQALSKIIKDPFP